MSHDRGTDQGHDGDMSPARTARSADRPSLFAGQDHTLMADGLPERQPVRLLSTLESAQRPARPAPSRRRRRQTVRWQTRVAVGLMGAGALAMLAAFTMVVREGNPTALPSAAGQLAARPAAAPPSAVQSALANLPAAPSVSVVLPVATSTAVAAPPAASPTASTVSPSTASTVPVAASTQNGASQPLASNTSPPGATGPLAALALQQGASAIKTSKHEAAPSTPSGSAASRDEKGAGTVASRSRQKTDTTLTQRAPHRPDAVMAAAPPSAGRGGSQAAPEHRAPQHAGSVQARAHQPGDDDVALVQALMSHARARTGPATGNGTTAASTRVTGADWQRCQSMPGAQAATCRARLCVQYPQDPACHSE